MMIPGAHATIKPNHHIVSPLIEMPSASKRIYKRSPVSMGSGNSIATIITYMVLMVANLMHSPTSCTLSHRAICWSFIFPPPTTFLTCIIWEKTGYLSSFSRPYFQPVRQELTQIAEPDGLEPKKKHRKCKKGEPLKGVLNKYFVKEDEIAGN